MVCFFVGGGRLAVTGFTARAPTMKARAQKQVAWSKGTDRRQMMRIHDPKYHEQDMRYGTPVRILSSTHAHG
jgi:hypothetical protein